MFAVGDRVSWKANSGFWITGPIKLIRPDGTLIVNCEGYPGGLWTVRPSEFNVTKVGG